MTHINEAMCVYIEDSHDTECPFCKRYELPQTRPEQSFVGAHNNGGKLELSLHKNGSFATNMTAHNPSTITSNYDGKNTDPEITIETDHIKAEAHHLVPGVEALHKVPLLEEWLVKEDHTVTIKKKTNTSPSTSTTQVFDDTHFNVNAHENGVWLPSVPQSITICQSGHAPQSQTFTNKTGWRGPTDHCKRAAFAIMARTGRQFHSGPHTDKGATPTQCYVTKAKRLLDQIQKFIARWSTECETAKAIKQASNTTPPKYPPPYDANRLIYLCASEILLDDVTRHPATWTVFVSELAYQFHLSMRVDLHQEILGITGIDADEKYKQDCALGEYAKDGRTSLSKT